MPSLGMDEGLAQHRAPGESRHGALGGDLSDLPEMAAVRAARQEAHFAFLRARRDKILIAGGLRPQPGAPFEGGLWIVEAESREAVMRIVAQDPSFDPSIRRVTIANWGRPFPEPVTL